MRSLPLLGVVAAVAIAGGGLAAPAVAEPGPTPPVSRNVEERPAVRHDTSKPLRLLAERASAAGDVSAPVLTERPLSVKKPTPGIRLNAMIVCGGG